MKCCYVRGCHRREIEIVFDQFLCILIIVVIVVRWWPSSYGMHVSDLPWVMLQVINLGGSPPSSKYK